MRHTIMVVSSDPLASVACKRGDLATTAHVDGSRGDKDQVRIRRAFIGEVDNIEEGHF